MSLLIGALYVLLLAAAGWWPMRAWARDAAGSDRLGRLSMAFALGAAITGLLQVALSALGLAATVLVPAALATASLLLVGRQHARARRATRPTPPPLERRAGAPRLPPGLAALLLVVALVSTGAAVGLPFRSDGSKFWASRARELALVGASQAPSLHDEARLAVHRNYPLLVPALLAPVFALSAPDAASGPKLVLAALNLALLGVLAGQLMSCGARGRLLLAVVATLPFLVGLDVRESAVSGGYVDSAQALFLLLVVVGVERLRWGQLRWGQSRRGEAGQGGAGDLRWGASRDAMIVIVFGAALLSTKLEGAAELAIVGGAWLLAGASWRWVGRCAVGAILLALPTFIIRSGVAADAPGFLLARLLDGDSLLARLPAVAAGLGGLLLDASCFGLLPPLLLLWLLPARHQAPGGPRTLALCLMLGAAGFLLLSYLATHMDAGRHIHTSAHRLAWHWLPALAWLAARARAADESAAGGNDATARPLGAETGAP